MELKKRKLNRMKTSFITTVLNEEKNIKEYLESIISQSKKPDEIIIIDAGSGDKTQAIIKSTSKITKIPVNLITKSNIPRSTARNLAVKKAKHPIIIVSDAGNILDKDWLKTIIEPFINKRIDSVAGFYQVKANTIFQKSVAPFVAIMPDKFDQKTFLPSSRSLAFKKAAWKKVGGYPEPLNTCEDLIFASKLKTQTNMAVKPNAIVYWRQANNLKIFFNMIKNYTKGDVQGKYQPHLKKILFVYLRILFLTIFPVLIPFYLLFSIIKRYHYVKHPLAFIYLPILQLTSDFAVIIGLLNGIISKL